MADVKRVLPAVDAESREFWEAAARGEFAYKRCVSCGRAHWYPRPHCPYCHADGTTWESTAGGGTVYTFTVIRQNSSSAFRDWVPYAMGMVDLDGGPRVFARFVGDISGLAVGSRVEVSHERVGDVDVPVFVTAAEVP
ncbi:Zn-ribbon domain-containing OB-fold protein [Sporichthya polymorpha]|uniref:Zn-ribbon domain-containing OB-fold protein n=1 Tax=Sporichthya polymorpha TaxID=35751 RepID=UPI000490A44E|nr:OB-fold domain-containing protein [Sporichthya polymorpha]